MDTCQWSLDELGTKIKNKTLLSDVRTHSKSITKRSFECGLTCVLLCASRAGFDLDLMEALLILCLEYYPVDYLYEYSVYNKESKPFHPVLRYASQSSVYIVTPPVYPAETLLSLKGTLLHIAAEAGNLKGVQMLLRHGAGINTVNCCGRTPLMMCAKYVDLAKYLIDRGCNVNHQDKSGQTILILLVDEAKSFRSLLKPLLKVGADPRIVDQYGKTMVHYICEQAAPSKSLVPLLFEHSVFQDIQCYTNGRVAYAGRLLLIKTHFQAFRKNNLFPQAFVYSCELMSLNRLDYAKKAPPILENIKKCGIVAEQYPPPDPVYGNRNEARTAEDLKALARTSQDWMLEVEYQRLLISERMFGIDSAEEGLVFLHILIEECGDVVRLDLIYRFLEKFSCILKKCQPIPLQIMQLGGTVAKLKELDLTKCFESSKCTLLQLLLKLTECVHDVIGRQIGSMHSHGAIATIQYPVIPSRIEFDTHYIIDSDLVEVMLFLIVKSFKRELEISEDTLCKMIAACDIYLADNGRFPPFKSNILYAYLTLTDTIDDNFFDSCTIIHSLSDKDLVNSIVPKGTTLLHSAIEKRHAGLLQYLIDQGAHPDAVDSNGVTPESLARSIGCGDDVMKIFTPNSLSCFAARAIIQYSIPYENIKLPDSIKRTIAFHDKSRFKM